MFCCTLLNVHSSFAFFWIGKGDLVALLSLSYWCLAIVVWLFLAVPWVCLQFVIVVFPDHTHLLLFAAKYSKNDTRRKITPIFALYKTNFTYFSIKPFQ